MTREELIEAIIVEMTDEKKDKYKTRAKTVGKYAAGAAAVTGGVIAAKHFSTPAHERASRRGGKLVSKALAHTGKASKLSHKFLDNPLNRATHRAGVKAARHYGKSIELINRSEKAMEKATALKARVGK